MGPPCWFRRLCTNRRAAPLLRNCDREIGPVCGAQDTHRNALELAGPHSRTLSDRARVLAGDVAEGAAEGAETAPAGFERDVGDRPIRVAQQRGGSLDTAREQVTVRRQAECLLEGAREVRLGYAAHLREAAHGPLLVRGAVHAVLRAQQAAQQLG